MPLVKTQAEGINLADTFAFTGTVSGAHSLTVGTPVSANGNDEVDIIGISSSAKRITLILESLSSDGNNDSKIQLGTSSGLQTSGYGSVSFWGSGGLQGVDDGMAWYGTNASNALSGAMIIYNFGSNYWVSHHTGKYNNNNGMFGGASVQLSGTLDRLRVRNTSTNTYDGGQVTIIVEE